MIKHVLAIAFSSAVAICSFTQAALAAEENKEISLDELISEVSNSAIVWLKKPIDEETIKLLSDKLKLRVERLIGPQENVKINLPEGDNPLSAIVVSSSAEQFETLLRKLSSDERQKIEIDFIEQNRLVYGLAADCEEPSDAPIDPANLPIGVRRVTEQYGSVDPGQKRVWIVDSGVASNFDKVQLNVSRAADKLGKRCELQRASIGSVANCFIDDADRDMWGHGTMIAGIIGATDVKNGVNGVAPGAVLIPVQIFTHRTPITDLRVAARALQEIYRNAQTGDVINLSWGTDWYPAFASQSGIENMLKKLVDDKGVMISIAAGNVEGPGKSGYVQAFSPARAGTYRNNGGAIVTVSAVKSEKDGEGWKDTFWAGSAFGNGKADVSKDFHLGPPDFAEPGVDVKSLWPGKDPTGKSPDPQKNAGRYNTCTGTSFATAHMSGILLKGLPTEGGRAEKDPSARELDATDYDDENSYIKERKDRVGIVPP